MLLLYFWFLQVGQEVFAELSRLEQRYSAAAAAANKSGGSSRRSVGIRGQVKSGDRDGGANAGASTVATVAVEAGGRHAEEEAEEEEEKELTMEEEVVRTCVSVCEMLEGCPQARHYVMSADR